MNQKKKEVLMREFEKRRTNEKRERIAAIALSALISKRDFPTLNDTGCVEFLTSLAVSYADELIMKLENTESPSDFDTSQ